MLHTPTNPLQVAVIGAGYWGKNLLRVCLQNPDVVLRYVCDSKQDILAKVGRLYPGVQRTETIEDILLDKTVEAVFLATPVESHFGLAKRFLEAGKHVWIEKPITKTVAQAQELIRCAKDADRLIIVDHTFLYTGAVQKIKKFLDAQELGVIRYVDSERINLGLIRADVDVLYDLASHDIALFQHFFQKKPERVAAVGASFVVRHPTNPIAEIAHLNLWYPPDIIAHIHTSWLSAVKVRKLVIGGSSKKIIYDDIEPVEKVRIYDYGVNVDFTEETTFNPIYRAGDILIPQLDDREALCTELDHFISCIREHKAPLTDGAFGADVVAVLEAAEESLRLRGMPVDITT